MRVTLCLVVLFACAWAGSIKRRGEQKARGSQRAVSDDVKFYLYSSTSPDTYEEIIPGGTVNNLVTSADIKIVVHGFQSTAFDDWMIDTKNAFIETTGSNVILVDWSAWAENIDYFEDILDAKAVGVYAATLVESLVQEQGFSISNIHAIGHSLGAHICGFIGKNVDVGTLGRITGLEPAYPGYELVSSDDRLASTDAVFVDVIHTNSGSLLDGDLSFEEPLGDADFYPNGGSQQPGCQRLIEFEGISSCNHDRSHDLFIDSITSESTDYNSYPCASDDDFESGNCFSCGSGCNNMGLYANSNATGTFYLATRAEAPFTAQYYRILMKLGELQLDTYGDLAFFLIDGNNVTDGYNLITHESLTMSEGIDRVMGFLPSLGSPVGVNLTFTRYDLGLSDTLKIDEIRIYNTDGENIASYTEKFDVGDEPTVITLTS